MANIDLEQVFFVPYVPPLGEDSSTQIENWLCALQLWNNSLRRLLQENDQKFQEFLAVSESFPIFAQTYLRYYSRETNTNLTATTSEAEVELSKRVLMVFFRISNGSDWAYMELLHRRNLLTVPILMDLALAYADSNSKITQLIFDKILTALPTLKESFKESFDFLEKYLGSIAKEYQGITANPPVSPTNELETLEKHLVALTDISRTLDNACKSSTFIGNLFNESKDLIDLWFNFYDVTIPAMQIYLLGMSPEESKPIRILMFRLKYSIMCLIYSTMDSCFFRPFHELTENQEEIEHVMEECCQTFMFVMERTNPTKEAIPFTNAPLLIDIEIEFGLSQNLARIKTDTFNGEDARLDFIISSLGELKARCGFSHRTSFLQSKESTFQAPSSAPVENDLNTYVKRSSFISQIQDLFPHLGDGFLEACLIEFNDDVERVIMLLLEDSLPPNLQQLDRSAKRPSLEPVGNQVDISEPTAPEDLISQRHNVFDNDEFDVFSGNDVDRSKINIGKKDRGTADDMLDNKNYVQNHKKSLLETLYNDDDDEYDDTYDGINEVGGSIDAHLLDDLDNQSEAKAPIQNEDPGITYESLLVQEMSSDPSVFDRSTKARKSANRQKLRQITGMSDEQIEGWYIMLMKRPNKGNLLEKYALQGNQNREIAKPDEKKEAPASSVARPPKNAKPQSGKGEESAKSQNANLSDRDKARKEKSKSKRANHNRKGQQMKKMALNNAI